MRLAHDDEGTGSAVVLLHSGVTDRRMWDDVVPTLSHSFRVVRPDLRGFGETPMPGEEYADADDVAALLDELGVASAAVVGSSFGGRVALELAVRHPGRVSSMVLLCPAWRGVDPDDVVRAFGDAEEALLEAGDVAGAVDLNVRTWLGPEAGDEVRARVAAMQRRAFEVQLAADELDPLPRPRRVDVDPGAVAVDTLVVGGAHDLEHFRLVARTLAERIPGADFLELRWAGHLPALERPDAVTTLLLDVLRDDPAVHAP
jgi:3-oxoadipate enol-lactonase